MYKKILLQCAILFHISICASQLNKDLISIILTIHNKEHQISHVIKSILDNTVLPYELVLVYDGCKDKSEKKVNETLAQARSENSPKEIKIAYTSDVNETIANNTGMKMAQGAYWILVQDDMQIDENGWDKKLITPMQKFNDVFAVSARWAASYPKISDSKTFVRRASYANVSSGKKAFAIRDTINRGPLALDAYYMQKLNYFDEIYAPLYLDDHDLCIRAYMQYKKVCGVYSVKIKNLKPTVPRDHNKPMSNGQFFKDVVKKNRKIFYRRYKDYFPKHRHDQDREVD